MLTLVRTPRFRLQDLPAFKTNFMIAWKSVVGYEGLYEVSDSGLIRTVERFYKAGWHQRDQLLKAFVLKPKLDKHGYLFLGLRKDKARKFKRVSRLVCEAFHVNTDNKPFVNHKNGIKIDNRAENLEWVTASENALHSINVLGNKPYQLPPMVGTTNPSARATNRLDHFGNVIKRYPCMIDAEREGFLSSKICLVASGKRKTHGGFKWEYA